MNNEQITALRKAYNSLYDERDREYRRVGMSFAQIITGGYVDPNDMSDCTSLVAVMLRLHGQGLLKAHMLDLEARTLLAEVMAESTR